MSSKGLNAPPGATVNIRDEIVSKRKLRLEQEGYGLSARIPGARAVPIVPFGADPFVICEIKRKSPSRGTISADMDPVSQAGNYVAAGIKSVSVLTEEDYFGGSLADLIAIKEAYPGLSVLRKDFLVDENDVLVSYRAGADAILLIAAMLTPERLGQMLLRARDLHMTALVEVHSAEEIEAVREFSPPLIGINSRNLEDFTIDRLLPLALRPTIDWQASVVFESGIFRREDAMYARVHRFQGILVGEAVMRHPESIPELTDGIGADFPLFHPRPWGFWQRIADRLAGLQTRDSRSFDRPLVKICGLCREEDARLAASLGADLLGFIFAPSPRRANAALVRSLSDLSVLKVAVVVGEIPAELAELVREGLIDAIQFSGDEAPEDCARLAWPYYKVLRPKAVGDLTEAERYRSPRLMLDAHRDGVYGGTGIRIADDIVLAAQSKMKLWIAGGIGPENVADLVRKFRPELIDLSSGVETRPGVKDSRKLRQLFSEIASTLAKQEDSGGTHGSL